MSDEAVVLGGEFWVAELLGCQRVMEGSNGQLGLGAWWPATALNGAQTMQRIDDGHKHERPHHRGRALQL